MLVAHAGMEISMMYGITLAAHRPSPSRSIVDVAHVEGSVFQVVRYIKILSPACYRVHFLPVRCANDWCRSATLERIWE
jgi:hypothetical protein